jgi:flagellar protein FliS
MLSAAYLESRVMSADPIELIHILYEHSILTVQDARKNLAAGEIAARSKAVSKAIAIVSELDSSLDHNTGGSLSQELARLYDFIIARLTVGNFEQRDEPLAEAESLLQTLAEGWSAIRPARAIPATPVYESNEQNDGYGSARSIPVVESNCAAHSWSA